MEALQELGVTPYTQYIEPNHQLLGQTRMDDAGNYYVATTLEEHEANIRTANQVNAQLEQSTAVEETGE